MLEIIIIYNQCIIKLTSEIIYILELNKDLSKELKELLKSYNIVIM